MTRASGGAAEFDLIDRIRARVLQRDDVVLGIGDDAALLQVPAGVQLVVAMDTLNEGVHFPLETAAYDVGWKALAVNLSDLAAMGAEPAWCTLSLSLPHADDGWVDGFIDGFGALAARHRVALVGGDTTRGPRSISVTVHGFVEPGRALRRDGARVDDEVWVSGTLGDAAAALTLLLSRGADEQAVSPGASSDVPPALRERLDRPTPRVALGRALAGIAHAAIDISDGLLADLGHLCAASGLGAELEVDALPSSDALNARFDGDQRRVLQATGGDDYELCFTAPAAARERLARIAGDTGLRITRIGRVTRTRGVRVLAADGQPWESARRGYLHFG